MPLANADNAYVRRSKLSAYLLNTAHRQGGPKAAVLRSFGYTDDTIDLLEQQLLTIVRTGDAVSSRPTYGGINYVVPGELLTPSGRLLLVNTVWFIGEGDDRPQFVTVTFP